MLSVQAHIIKPPCYKWFKKPRLCGVTAKEIELLFKVSIVFRPSLVLPNLESWAEMSVAFKTSCESYDE